MFTVKDIQAKYGVTEHTVLGWLRSGELRGVNVGRKPGAKKPRWRISSEALAQFELARESGGPAPAKARRKKQTAGVIEFYPV